MTTVLYFLKLLLLFGVLVLGGVILKNIWQGLKTGRLKHTDTFSVVLRKATPIRFWLIFIVLFGFGIFATLLPIVILLRNYF